MAHLSSVSACKEMSDKLINKSLKTVFLGGESEVKTTTSELVRRREATLIHPTMSMAECKDSEVRRSCGSCRGRKCRASCGSQSNCPESHQTWLDEWFDGPKVVRYFANENNFKWNPQNSLLSSFVTIDNNKRFV